MSTKRKNVRALIQWFAYYVMQFLFLGLIPSFFMKYRGHSWQKAGKWFQITGIFGLKIFGIQEKMYNPYNIDLKGSQFIIAGNHRSWFDQVAITAIMPKPFHILANDKYFKMPTLGYSLKTWQAIRVCDHKISPEDNQNIMDYLELGDNVFFFFEGTRGKGKSLLPFKKGAFKFSALTQVKLLPLYILGAEDCLHKSKSLLTVNSGKISIVIGQEEIFTANNLESQIEDFQKKYKSIHDELFDAFYVSDKFFEKTILNLMSNKLQESNEYENFNPVILNSSSSN